MSLEVLAAGVLTTVQDAGRPGYAHLGVPRAGALDAPAAALANRLVGNEPSAAVLEVTLGGLRVRSDAGLWVAVTGALASVTVGGAARGHGRAEWLPAGGVLEIGVPATGVRSYVAVAGGIAVEPVLGSRSTDTLAGIGPARVGEGDVLPVGGPTGTPAWVDTPPRRTADGLRVHPGPRPEWFADDVVARLCAGEWTVLPASDRVGLRVAGEPLPREPGELLSEGMVLGAVQVPPDGQPVVFLNDHPTTGGYPVAAVVDPADLWQCAQARPGERVRFRDASSLGSSTQGFRVAR
ncbi:biotin-dependent carboxyltransferase family protein [Nocardioides sp. KR10-350]|uniref:5-oxoprolinase subunit C family protein n=1 Tax=Nocardioides cheoyonin TaxID=3156615 RepID=UPI0032B4AFF5